MQTGCTQMIVTIIVAAKLPPQYATSVTCNQAPHTVAVADDFFGWCKPAATNYWQLLPVSFTQEAHASAVAPCDAACCVGSAPTAGACGCPGPPAAATAAAALGVMPAGPSPGPCNLTPLLLPSAGSSSCSSSSTLKNVYDSVISWTFLQNRPAQEDTASRPVGNFVQACLQAANVHTWADYPISCQWQLSAHARLQ